MKHSSTPELFLPRKHEPKIALFDIETAPYLGYVWEKYDTNVIEFVSGGYMLCFSVKWLGKEKVEVWGLPDFPGYEKNKQDDLLLLTKLWEVMNQADIIIGHNGDAFDLKTSYKRMALNGLTPPPDFKTIDTLKVVRSRFKFPSNKLDDLGNEFKIGRKLPHTGFHLWKGCMAGDPHSWDLMKRYNKQDVVLLEKVYLKIRPWIKNHPNLNVYTRTANCPKCGSNKVQNRGYEYGKTVTYQRRRCSNCKGWFKGGRIYDDEL